MHPTHVTTSAASQVSAHDRYSSNLESLLSAGLMHCAAEGVNFVQDSFGKSEYLAQCEQLGIIPSTQVVKFLQHDELDLAHYGLGDKGVMALSAALLVRISR